MCIQYGLALQNYKFALDLDPDHPQAFVHYIHTLRTIGDYQNYDLLITKLLTQLNQQLTQYNTDHLLHTIPTLSPTLSLLYPTSINQQYIISQIYAKKARENIIWEERLLIHKPKDSDSRLKIGYISAYGYNSVYKQLTHGGKIYTNNTNIITI